MPKKQWFTPNIAGSNIQESKSQVNAEIIKFPRNLGEEHPFDFNFCEDTYKKVGLMKAAVDKHMDFIVSPGFYVKSDNKKIETIIMDFIRQTNLSVILREWILSSASTGNGFMEISQNKGLVDLKVIKPSTMYIQRDSKGNVTGFNQYFGDINRFDSKKVIPFKPYEIAHLPFDKVAGEGYGIGIIYPALKHLDYMAKSEKDMHILQSRKANAPIHAKLGSIEQPVSAADVASFGAKFDYLNNLHEWCTDHLVEFKVIDFGNLAEKFTAIIDHDKEMIFYITQVPAMLMGSAYQNEGIAKVQLDAFERRIQSKQAVIEKIVEEQIFKVILANQGLKGTIEMYWGMPSDESVNKRISSLTLLMNNPMLSNLLRARIEIDLASVLGYEDLKLPSPESENERKKEEAMNQPEVPGEKKNIESLHLHEMDDSVSLTEWVNFNYLKYKEEVLKFIEKYDFDNLMAKNELDRELGLLNEAEIKELRAVLYKNFSSNGTIREISDGIKKLNLPERYVIGPNKEKILQLSKEERPIMIARTESVKVATGGLLDHYESNGIDKVQWLASISDRTCPKCTELNGQIFELTEARDILPAHPACRCSYLAVTE